MTAGQQNWAEDTGDALTAAHPVAPPVASTQPNASPLVNRDNPRIGLTNDGAHTGTTGIKSPVRQRTHADEIDAIKHRLSARDYAVIQSVAQHRLLTTPQIEILHFADNTPSAASRTARDVMARLRRLRLLGALDRRVGGINAGSQGIVHYVDVVGDRILHDRPGRRSRRPHEPTERFMRHVLSIADAHITLITAHRKGVVDLVESAVEPSSWRHHAGLGGARLTLKPDLYAETATADDLVHAWFIEVDLGTESIPTLAKKAREYETYRQTGIEQDRHGAFPLVVWSITHKDPAKAERRRQALADAIAADPRLPGALFRIVAPEGVLPLIHAGGSV